EMLDEVGVINMNGRMYDPLLGRFMSADPSIQSPYNLQSYNRYSYCWNNPMVCSDPSGYFSLGDFFRAAVAVAAVVYAPELIGAGGFGTSVAATLGTSVAVGNGIVGGAILGYVTGGTPQSTLIGAASGAMFGAIGDYSTSLAGQGYSTFADGGIGRATLHAFGGGMMSIAQGGNFGSGAMAAGFAELAGPMTSGFGPVGQGVSRMVIGGTASVIGGGKFENGAITAAYAYLFNTLGHKLPPKIQNYFDKFYNSAVSLSGVSASPCDGVDRSLSGKRKLVLAPKIAKELHVSSVDVLQSFKSHGWSIIYIDTHVSDETFLFYKKDPLTSHYVTLWGGAATIYEEQQIKEWVLKNAPKIPLKLANCFAWHVTHDRDM
ncbi:MAG: hypothetical protein K2P57_07850, partial [Burkholderiales bacterium]|nr:hypothetical protein [Burkholderiales bacterium]